MSSKQRLGNIHLDDIYILIIFSDLLVISKPRSHPFRNDNAIPQLISKRKLMHDRQVKSISDFASTDHDLEFIRGVPLSNIDVTNQDFPGN